MHQASDWSVFSPDGQQGLIILSSFISGRINNIRGPITVVIYSVSDMHACCVTRFWLQWNPRGPNTDLWGIPVILQSRIKQSNKTSQWNDPCFVITHSPPSWVPPQSLSTLQSSLKVIKFHVFWVFVLTSRNLQWVTLRKCLSFCQRSIVVGIPPHKI